MDIFKAENYREFLTHRLNERRGLKSEFAEHLGCQSGYVSQILQNLSDLSLEQGMRASVFLKLTEEESHFFMLLLQQEKASTPELKKYFKTQIIKIKRAREEISNRISVNTDLNAEDYHQYYSSWEFAAIHILTSIPKYQSKNAIVEKLRLNYLRVSEVLNFLISKRLVLEKDGKYVIGDRRIHLTKDSPYILAHHQNWRLHSTRVLSDKNPLNLNYSAVLSLSNQDIEKIKEILLQAIVQNEKILANTGEEEMIYVGLDMNVF